MKVNLEYVRELQESLAAIDAVPLATIEWYADGQRIDVADEKIKSWVSNNTSFAEELTKCL